MLPLLLALAALATGPADDHLADRAALLDGVERLEAVGVPGPVVVFGPDAFAVLTDAQGQAVVAAARFGEGRVVALGHGGYLDEEPEGPGHARLLLNAIRWASGGKADPRTASSERGEPCEGADVVLWGGGPFPPEERARLRRFVERGGGLVLGQCPWGWQQLQPRRSLREDMPANRLLAPMGLVFGPSYLEGPFEVAASRPERAHAGAALAELVEQGATDRLLVLERALQALPADDELLLPAIGARVAQLPPVAPSEEHPLRAGDGLGRLAAAWWTRRWEDAPPEELTAAPGIEHFPGAVPDDAPRVARELRIEAPPPGWISTGLYAPAGEAVEVRVREGSARGWWLIVGPHTDSIGSHDAWRRWPEVSRERELAGPRTVAASPFGGLVYLQADEDEAGPVALEVSGVVDAPWFDLSDPEAPEAWERERADPAPWAEISGAHLILTVPSSSVRDLDDPAAVARFWDAVVEAHYRLAQRPLPARPERFVADVQISAGYMHAGYPIMTHLDVTRPTKQRPIGPVLDVAALREHGSWGHFHELGHNCQRPWWTFAGTGEVTCNVFTLHAMDRVVGLDPWEVEWLEEQKPRAAPYLERGAPYDEWRRRPGLALLMYAQVQRAFGWEPFYRAFAAYEALPASERPVADDARRDRWMVELSMGCQRDLGPFFARWGVPVSAAARAEVAELADWMPDFAELGVTEDGDDG